LRGRPAYQIPVTFVREELDGKATGIAGCIGRAFFTTDRRESNKDGSLLADLAKQVGHGQVRDIIGHFEDTMCAGTLGVDNTDIRPIDKGTYRSGIRSRSK